MKTQFLLCLLVLVMMLCGCTAAASDAAPESAAPASLSESVQPAGSAHTGTSASWTDDGAKDGFAAPEDAQDGRLLSDGERQALWAQLKGKWILSDPAEWVASDGFACPVYEFISSEDGGCTLLEYSGYGSGAYRWDWTAAREQNGVYTIRVTSESGEMTQYDCHQNSGTLFTLQFTEDGDMLLARSRPTRFEWWETESEEEYNPIIETRPATLEEQQRLAAEGDEYGRARFLEEGCAIIAGYEKSASSYRPVTDEELARLLEEMDA